MEKWLAQNACDSAPLRWSVDCCCRDDYGAGSAPVSGLEYSPWMVANITLDALPAGHGVALAWDNVARDSRSLGCVATTPEHLHSVPRETILTHYWPLDDAPPRDARQQALPLTHADWCGQIIADIFHTFSPHDVSGGVIAASHVAIHTWPEHACTAADIISCGTKLDHTLIRDHLRTGFAAANIEAREFTRG